MRRKYTRRGSGGQRTVHTSTVPDTVDPVNAKAADVKTLMAGAADHPALEALVAAIEAEDRHTATRDGLQAFLDRFAPLDADSQTRVLLGTVGGKPAGVLCATAVPKLDSRQGFLFVDELYVLTGFRRNGVGTALLRTACDLARRLGLSGVRLLARPENRAALSFYDGLGFNVSDARFHELRV